MKIAVVGVLFLGLFSGTATAFTANDFNLRTGHDLVRLCSVSKAERHHREAVHLCIGYLVGVAHFHRAAAKLRRIRQLYCLPTDLTRVRAARTVLSWAKANPSYLDKPALEVFLRAAQASWPCKK